MIMRLIDSAWNLLVSQNYQYQFETESSSFSVEALDLASLASGVGGGETAMIGHSTNPPKT